MNDDQPKSEEDYEGPLCPVCLAPIEGDFDHCPKCDTPLSQYATSDPLKAIPTEGEMFRRGAHSPTLMVVVGLWLIFSPVLLIAGYLTAVELRESGRMYPPSVFTLLFAIFYAVILYKVTSRYIKGRRQRATEPPEE